MKRKLLLTASVLALSCASAMAADLGRGGLKDEPGYDASDVRTDHSGLAVRAMIGYSWGDRDVKQNFDADLSLGLSPNADADEDKKADIIEGLDLANKELQAGGVNSTFDGNKLSVPIAGLASLFTGSDDYNALTGTGEIEYLWHRGQFGLGIALGATFYGDNKSKWGYDQQSLKWKGGTLLSESGNSSLEGGKDSGLGIDGYATAERIFDIDPVIKGYYFINNDTAVYAKAGPSFSRAKVSGGNSHPALGAIVDYEETDVSIGYVVGGGFIHWFKPNLAWNLDFDWKQHTFDASGSRAENLYDGTYCDVDMTLDAKARGKTDVDDGVFNVKTGLSYHF